MIGQKPNARAAGAAPSGRRRDRRARPRGRDARRQTSRLGRSSRAGAFVRSVGRAQTRRSTPSTEAQRARGTRRARMAAAPWTRLVARGARARERDAGDRRALCAGESPCARVGRASWWKAPRGPSGGAEADADEGRDLGGSCRTRIRRRRRFEWWRRIWSRSTPCTRRRRCTAWRSFRRRSRGWTDYLELAEGVTRDGRFKALAESVASRVDEFDAFGLANVAWVCCLDTRRVRRRRARWRRDWSAKCPSRAPG